MAKTIIIAKRNPELLNKKPFLKHSAKGSSWKKHKYIKKVGDKYIYADTKNGEGDETEEKAANGESTENTDAKKEGENTSENPEEFDLEAMANKVIRGEFGNGADRKELLGDAYADIQKRVNEILKGSGNKTEISKKDVETGKKAVDDIKSKDAKKGGTSGGRTIQQKY